MISFPLHAIYVYINGINAKVECGVELLCSGVSSVITNGAYMAKLFYLYYNIYIFMICCLFVM